MVDFSTVIAGLFMFESVSIIEKRRKPVSDNLPLWMKLDLLEQKEDLERRLAKVNEHLECPHELNREYYSAMQSFVTCKNCDIGFHL